MGNNEVLINFNPNHHHNLTSCSCDCIMYAYVEVYCIIYFCVLNIISVLKKHFNKKFVNVGFVFECPKDDLDGHEHTLYY